MRIPGGSGRDGDDEKFLAFERFDDGSLVAVVDRGDCDAFGDGVSAALARESGNVVFASLQEGRDEVGADGASGLR